MLIMNICVLAHLQRAPVHCKLVQPGLRPKEPMNFISQTDTSLIDECFRRSVELLRINATADGILAASPSARAETRNYTSIFGRDAAICAIGMTASREPDLVDCAEAGLLTLARHQAANGQIPKFVRPQTGEADFWYTGCIDATLWWLIAIRLHDGILSTSGLTCRLEEQVKRAVHWLRCQEHQEWRLLQQNEASDWADIMPRSGFVLYTNSLWHWVKKLYRLDDTHRTRESADLLFCPFGRRLPDNRRLRLLTHYVRNKARRTPLYLSFVNFATWGEEADVLGNILAGLTGLADTSRAGKIAEAVLAMGAGSPFPVRVVGQPLCQDSPLWRPYMERHRQNLPWHYHNGGIWPFAGGFFVLLLARLGKKAEAWKCLENFALASRLNGWEFNEWLHGKTGEPMGMPGQSWNASLFLLACLSLRQGTNFLSHRQGLGGCRT